MKLTIGTKSELSEDEQKVNCIIKKSFGILYSGNNHIGQAGIDGYKEKTGGLETIAKPTLSGDPACGVGVIGSLNEDGSSITIREGKRWLKKAEKYASLYKEVFGRNVEISVSKENYF